MKIVILDGYTTNPGDLSWEGFSELGEYTVYDYTDPEDLLARCADMEYVVTNKCHFGEEEFTRLPKLKYIGLIATGYDVIDLKAADKHGITVTNVPVYANYSVSQLCFALIMELTYRIERHHNSIAVDKYWSRTRYNTYWLKPIHELAGQTIGLVGFGRIGERVGLIAKGYGMNVITYDIYPREVPSIPDLKWVDLDTLLKESDIVSVHCPLTPETKGMFNKETFAKMKNSALLINTSRGPLVVEKDLVEALNNDVIGGVGLDVLESEPPAEDNPLFTAKNCVLTPHIGWAASEARGRLIRQAIDNIKAYNEGNPICVLNKK